MSFEHSNPFAGPSPAASPEPASAHQLMVYGGQMWSREMAETKRAELMAKPEYADAFNRNDQAKLTELKDLYMLARGLEPSAPPATQVDVMVQTIDREQRSYLQHDAALRQMQPDLTDQQRHEITHVRPLMQWEKDEIAAKHARNMRNQDFVDRLNRRDPQAVRDMYLASYARVAPVARSLADIDAWNARFPFTSKASA